ncbi:MAG: TonB-dependent receptor plug domain-containing protein [Telluria sp.]
MPTSTRRARARVGVLRLTVLAAAIAANGAHAQDGQPKLAPESQQRQTADAGMQKVEVRGSADAYDPRRDDTASKIVVTHDEIIKYGDTSVLDVLKRVPGVTVTGSGGRGGEVRMRGLGSGYTQILINGERAPAGFTLDSLAPDVIERIEVLRAASAEFSTQAVAGTINIVLKKSVKGAQRDVKIGTGQGTGFTNPVLNLQLADRAGKTSWSLPVNLVYQRQERSAPAQEADYDLAGTPVARRTTDYVSDNHALILNSSPRVNWTLDGGDTLSWQGFVNANAYRANNFSDTSTPLGAAPPFPVLELGAVSSFAMLKSELNWMHKLASGSKLDMKVSAMGITASNVQERDAFRDGAQVLDSVTDNKGHDFSLSSTGKYTNPLVEGHALALGWDAGYGRHFESRVQDDAPIGGSTAYFLDQRFQARSARLAAYAQDEWNITERWSLYLGARWEGIRIQTSGNDFETARTNSSVLSPLVQTLYKLPGTKADQVRFAVTRTYKAPDLLVLPPRRFVSPNNGPTEPDYIGNPQLRPELALGFDAAYEHYFGEGGLLSLSASRRSIEDFTRNLIVFLDGRWVQMPLNEGKAETRTVEAEAKVPLKSLLANAPAIDLRASASRNWSTVDSVPGPDNRLDQQTPFSATLGIDYKAGALSAGGSFAFRSGGPVRLSQDQASYQNVRRDLDVYALWKFNPRYQLRVALSNLLRQDGLNAISYATPAGLSTRSTVYPGFMVARVTLEMKL